MSAVKSPIIGNLTKLSHVVPLNTPYGISVSVGNICDFRCSYCFIKDTLDEQKFKPSLTSLEDFNIFVSQLKEFDEPIRQVSIVSSGETILNRNLPQMIKNLKAEGVAQKVKITTNANKLTNEFTDKLLDAGLDILKISLQGLSEEKYRKICSPPKSFSYERFVNQIQYFYENRGDCKVHIKIVNVALDEGEEEKFYDFFGKISDYVFVEECCEHTGGNNANRFNMDFRNYDICPSPFYMMVLDHKGNVYPCCYGKEVVNNPKVSLGNIKEHSLKYFWDNNFRKLQYALLKNQVREDSVCCNCTLFKECEKSDNVLDLERDKIIERFELRGLGSSHE